MPASTASPPLDRAATYSSFRQLELAAFHLHPSRFWQRRIAPPRRFHSSYRQLQHMTCCLHSSSLSSQSLNLKSQPVAVRNRAQVDIKSTPRHRYSASRFHVSSL